MNANRRRLYAFDRLLPMFVLSVAIAGCSFIPGLGRKDKSSASPPAAAVPNDDVAPVRLTLAEPTMIASFDSLLPRLSAVTGVTPEMRNNLVRNTYNQIVFNLPTNNSPEFSGSNAVAQFKLCAAVNEVLHYEATVRDAFYGPEIDFTKTVTPRLIEAVSRKLIDRFWSYEIRDLEPSTEDMAELTGLANDVLEGLPPTNAAIPLGTALGTAICASAQTSVY
jgi:hypothetical protein